MSAVIADVARGADVLSLVISVAEIPAAEIVHRLVVAEAIVAPVAAFISGATVAVSIVHAAVESDFISPIPAVPRVQAVVPSPISRSPQQAFAGRLNPGARHPEIALVAVGPVARCPQIAFLRAGGLRVNDQCGRSDRDGRAELRAGRRGHCQNYQRQQKIWYRAEYTHFSLPFLIILRLPGMAWLLRVARMEAPIDLRIMTHARFQVCSIWVTFPASPKTPLTMETANEAAGMCQRGTGARRLHPPCDSHSISTSTIIESVRQDTVSSRHGHQRKA